jgi:hypothetical protein
VQTYSVELSRRQPLYSTQCKRLDCHHGGYFGQRRWSIIVLTLLPFFYCKKERTARQSTWRGAAMLLEDSPYSTRTEVMQFNYISSNYFNYTANSCLWPFEGPRKHLFKFKQLTVVPERTETRWLAAHANITHWNHFWEICNATRAVESESEGILGGVRFGRNF